MYQPAYTKPYLPSIPPHYLLLVCLIKEGMRQETSWSKECRAKEFDYICTRISLSRVLLGCLRTHYEHTLPLAPTSLLQLP